MDVIESLKQKSEENEPAEQEPTNGLEESTDLGSVDEKTGKKTENVAPKDDLENALPDCEEERTSKRRKVDTAQVGADDLQ